jgi:hypothetical protein
MPVFSCLALSILNLTSLVNLSVLSASVSTCLVEEDEEDAVLCNTGFDVGGGAGGNVLLLFDFDDSSSSHIISSLFSLALPTVSLALPTSLLACKLALTAATALTLVLLGLELGLLWSPSGSVLATGAS